MIRRAALVALVALPLALSACQSPGTSPTQPQPPAGNQSMDPNMPGMSMDASPPPSMDTNMPGMSMDSPSSAP